MGAQRADGLMYTYRGCFATKKCYFNNKGVYHKPSFPCIKNGMYLSWNFLISINDECHIDCSVAGAAPWWKLCWQVVLNHFLHSYIQCVLQTTEKDYNMHKWFFFQFDIWLLDFPFSLLLSKHPSIIIENWRQYKICSSISLFLSFLFLSTISSSDTRRRGRYRVTQCQYIRL